jgi:hypothetical protein
MANNVLMFAPTQTGSVVGGDGLTYHVRDGLVRVPPGLVASFVTLRYAVADTPELDTLAEIDSTTSAYLTGITPGTTAASKGLVLDAAESLNWATTDSTASETCTLTVTDTRTGAGAVGWAGKFDLTSNVALGSYANGLYGIINFGASGRVTGLAAGVVSETVLSAGCTQGTYAGLEVELGMPANAVTGTETSLLYLSVYGAAAGAFDTSGFLFSLVGVTKNTGKMLADATTGATERPKQCLRVKTPDGTRYIPLYDTVAIAA